MGSPLLTRKAQSFDGVAAGQTATCKLAIGNTYHQLFVNYAGATLAQLNELRLVANGKTIQRLKSGAILDSMNQFDGRNAASGVICIDMDRYGMRTRAGQIFTAIGTGVRDRAAEPNPITTLLLEIDIDAAAVGPTLSAIAVQSGPSPASWIKHVKVFTHSPTAAGEYEISDLPRLGHINRIFLKSTAVINSIKGDRDGYRFFDRTQAENEVIQADGIRVVQAGYYVVDFSEEGNAQDWLETQDVNDLRFLLDMAAAGTVDVIVEYIAPIVN